MTADLNDSIGMYAADSSRFANFTRISILVIICIPIDWFVSAIFHSSVAGWIIFVNSNAFSWEMTNFHIIFIPVQKEKK